MATVPWVAFLYRANKRFLPLYMLMAGAYWPLRWGSWEAWRPELWRAAGGITNPSINTHHTLVIWGLIVLWFVLTYAVRLNPMLAVFATFIVLAWHEILWWVVDYVVGDLANPLWLLGGYLYPLSTILAVFYTLMVNKPWRYIAAMGVFYVAWYEIGFPVTVHFHGRTALYGDAFTNWLEIGSWAFACVAFYVLERKRLVAWQARASSQIRLTLGSSLSNNHSEHAGTMKTTMVNSPFTAYALAKLCYALLVAPVLSAARYHFAALVVEYDGFVAVVVVRLFPTWTTRKRHGIAAIVEIAVGLILFATLGFVALTMLQTSSTAGWSTSVATVAVTVVGILAAIAVALTFYHYAKLASTF
jgi:hypothetical protein